MLYELFDNLHFAFQMKNQIKKKFMQTNFIRNRIGNMLL